MRAIIPIYKVFSLIITQISMNNDCVLWAVDIYTQGDRQTGQTDILTLTVNTCYYVYGDV